MSITGWTRAYLFSLPRCLIDAELDESGAGHGEAGPDAVETLDWIVHSYPSFSSDLADRARDARSDHGRVGQ